MEQVMILLELVSICAIFVSLCLLLPRDGAREQKLMIFFLCGSLVQNVGYLLELTAPSLEVAVAAVKVEYLGSIFVPLCYCLFTYVYCCEKPSRLIQTLFRLLGGSNFAMLAVIFFCDRHTLFYRSMAWLATDYGYHYLSLSYGPLYLFFMVFQCIIPYFASILVLLRAVLTRSDSTVNRQCRAILVISMIPVAALLAYAVKLTYVFDPTPLALGLSLSSVSILIWTRRNYSVRRLASDTVLGNMSDGVIALDEQKRLVSFNRAAAGIFPRLNDLKPGEYVGNAGNFSEEALTAGAHQEFTLGGRFYEGHTQQITDENGKPQGYVVLVLDVTDTKNYIDEIKRVRIQAEQANLAKSEFLANMSHEIRTPMNAIIGLSDIVLEESRDTGAYVHIRDIRSAAQSLLAIINDILDLSKVEAGKMELILTDYNLKTTVDEVVNMMDMAASQRGLVLKYELDSSIPCGYCGDEGRVKQILINVLNNAVKFTTQGYVRLSVSGRPGDSPDEELLTFVIEDTGCGIREEDQEKIFEDFRQVDSRRNRAVEGTGLGLSIVKHLVRLMGGSIRLHSVYGQGTTFTITIPQRIVDRRTLAQAPANRPKEAEQAAVFRAPGFRVLIVDDNAVNRKVARGFLKGYDFQLTDAESGQQAIALVRENQFDLIFMDHMMPVMDGIEAAEIIRRDCGENGARPILIALTANAMEGMREKFLGCGFQDFLAKPLARKPLNDLLLRWVPRECREGEDGGATAESAAASFDPQAVRVPGIDSRAAALRHTGTLEEYLELLELFRLDGRRKSALLAELAEQEDWKSFEIEVHGLKSAAANIGAMELSELAKTGELAARGGDIGTVLQTLPLLMERYEGLLGELKIFLAGHSAPERGEALPELSARELEEKLRGALEALEDFRSKECAGQVEELLKHRLGEKTAAALGEIQEELKMYEDDAAEGLLRRLLETVHEEGELK